MRCWLEHSGFVEKNCEPQGYRKNWFKKACDVKKQKSKNVGKKPNTREQKKNKKQILVAT